MEADDILTMAGQILAMRNSEQIRLHRISKYVKGRQDPPYTPKGASTEYRWLVRRSKDNFLPLIVSVISQNLHVDGYRPTGSTAIETVSNPQDEPSWAAFRANRLISRQHGVHRSLVKYGTAYVTCLPGRLNDSPMPVLRPVSPRHLTALYADDIDDEWPIVSIEEHIVRDNTAPGKARRIITVMDDTNRYFIIGTMGTTSKLGWPDPNDPILNGRPIISEHGMGVCPVVRFTYEADLDGETDVTGEIEPLISLQDQINFHTFNTMLAEQFAAYRQRWVTGMDPVDETGRENHPFNPGVDRMLASSDSSTKFGEFDVTPLDPYLNSREATIRHMSTISQIPPYHLLGALVNLSADALSAARDGLDRKIEELQAVLNDSWRNVFRIAAKASGDEAGWDDLFGTVIWRDTSARSFAATIDGLGKAAQLLGIPAEELWRRIPGVTADDVEVWKRAAMSAGAQAQLDRVVEAALTAGIQTQNPTPAAPYQLPIGLAPTGTSPKPAPPASAGSTGGAERGGGSSGPASATPATGSHQVAVPAHTRSMPDKPASATGAS